MKVFGRNEIWFSWYKEILIKQVKKGEFYSPDLTPWGTEQTRCPLYSTGRSSKDSYFNISIRPLAISFEIAVSESTTKFSCSELPLQFVFERMVKALDVLTFHKIWIDGSLSSPILSRLKIPMLLLYPFERGRPVWSKSWVHTQTIALIPGRPLMLMRVAAESVHTGWRSMERSVDTRFRDLIGEGNNCQLARYRNLVVKGGRSWPCSFSLVALSFEKQGAVE